MAREAKGEFRPLAEGFEARITVEGTRRKGFFLPFPHEQEAEARARCEAMATIAVRMRRAGHTAHIIALLTDAATAKPGKGWEAILAAVDALCAGAVEERRTASFVTMSEHAKLWYEGTYAKTYRDHIKEKGSADTDKMWWTHYIEKTGIGSLAVSRFTLEHADAVMASLPDSLSSASRRHVAQVVSRLMTIAVYPCKLRPDNPIPRGWLPKVKQTRAFGSLQPAEDAALLACTAVPLLRRLMYGVLIREGMRVSEAADMRWRDLDLEHGSVSLDENKTDDPRTWALDPGVTRALKAWKERFHKDAEPSEHVFAEGGVPLTNREGLATMLRRDLLTAGVTREQLHTRTATRAALRAHDLRASFITLNLAAGRNEAWISDRTGHGSSQMIMRYKRAARTWSELNLGTVAPLDASIPELAPTPPVNPPSFPHDEETMPDAAPRHPKNQRKTWGSGSPAMASSPFNPSVVGSSPTQPTKMGDSLGDSPPPLESSPGSRGAAVAALYEQASALAAAGDLAGARALHAAVGALLGDGATASPVIDLADARREREGR